MKQEILEADEAETSLFKKKLKRLGMFKGKGTELISLYLPPDSDRSSVMGQLTEERSQSSNIKDPSTRKNVQGALKKIDNFLKRIDFKLPSRGLVVFAGNISETEGKTDLRLFTIKPVKLLKTKRYWCDSEFHLDPLQEMMQPSEVFAILTIDKNESTIALLSGKKYEIIGHFTSGVAGKTRAGGQSAQRFERLRAEATHAFYKRISEKMNQIFVEYDDKLTGIIVGGPGITKNYFLNEEMLDHRLQKKVIGTIDTSYTDESGVRETVQKSDSLLKDTEIMKEKKVIETFMGEVVKHNSLATYGQKEVEEAIELGKVEKLLLSEDIEWVVYKFICNNCNTEEEIVVKEPDLFEENSLKCKKCDSSVELLEEDDYIDWIIEKANNTGAKTKIISTETPEGEQFFKGFGGIGAMLRYR